MHYCQAYGCPRTTLDGDRLCADHKGQNTLLNQMDIARIQYANAFPGRAVCQYPACFSMAAGASRYCKHHSPDVPGMPPVKLPVGETMADKYPKYYKAIPKGWDSMDTYAVNKLFPVDDPSGAILHARKKLLIPGSRTGGKSMRKDITEARDALNRWLELNPE